MKAFPPSKVGFHIKKVCLLQERPDKTYVLYAGSCPGQTRPQLSAVMHLTWSAEVMDCAAKRFLTV